MIKYSQNPQAGTRTIKIADEREQEAKKNSDPRNVVEESGNDVDDDGSEA